MVYDSVCLVDYEVAVSQSRVLLGVKLALAVMVVIAYLAFCLLALLAGLDSPTPIEVIRHAIFVTGLVPLCAWLLVIFCTRRQGVMKIFSLAMIITVYHFVLFAVSDGF